MGKSFKPYLKILFLIIIFALLFLIQFLNYLKIINVFVTGVLGTLWYWNYITIGIISIFYISKIRKFNFRDFIIGFIISAGCCINGFNPVITPIVFLSFSAGASIFREYNQEFKFSVNLKNILKSIVFGILIGIIPGIINIIEYFLELYVPITINFYDIWQAFLRALNPAISEEIVFRFFPLAFITNAFKGKIQNTKIANFLIYFLLIIPHNIMHDSFFPEYWMSNTLSTILYLIYMCIVFGVPSVWLIKNKNIWSSMGFHWFCDFARFVFFKN